ncbi:MAG: tail fiber domain-containing protein [Phocaeicola sp.]|uniref:tail fiber domain-containing protein n=1 Tax=Phocaeicola sp. TaxID=2773926 RepID=UPI003F9FC50B
MKKIISIMFLCVFSSTLFAQLKVSHDGKVSIGITQPPVSNFAVGAPGYPHMRNIFESDMVTMIINGKGKSPYHLNYWGTALMARNVVSSDRGDIGIDCAVSNPSGSNSGRAIGIVGTASNATPGYNYGVIGNLNGSNNGTGILGTIGTLQGVYIDGKYAGYFNGNVKVTGTIIGTVTGNSDIRYKQNIEEISSNGIVSALGKPQYSVLDKITALRPISYNYKQVYFEPQSDTLRSSRRGLFDERSLMFRKRHFGLAAQELQKIYPELVYEEDNGYLSVNYIEIIPLLIQSIKELKAEVDRLSSGSIRLQSGMLSNEISEISNAVLYQNTPNPFTDHTEIKFLLPESIRNASICIFNMQGNMVKQISINSDQHSVIVDGLKLGPGMYLYSLIAEGKLVDTKRMILTK